MGFARKAERREARKEGLVGIVLVLVLFEIGDVDDSRLLELCELVQEEFCGEGFGSEGSQQLTRRF